MIDLTGYWNMNLMMIVKVIKADAIIKPNPQSNFMQRAKLSFQSGICSSKSF